MINSLRQLFQSPYNKQNILFAIYRFLTWKMIRVLKINSYRFNIWGNRKINLHFDSVQSAWVMYNYLVDWEEFHFIKNYVKGGDTMIDIGSNIGTYVLWASKFIGTGKIHAFEPDPQSYKRLTDNIKINNLEKIVDANRVGIADVKGFLHFSTGLDIQNQIINHPTDMKTQLITCTTLDDYVIEKNISHINYLKIDIEGFEYNALKGARNLLSRGSIDFIQLEINDKIVQANYTPCDLIALMESYHYDLCSFNTKRNQLVKVSYNRNRENYFFIKSSTSNCK